jgi:hypothetical protein
MTPIAAIGNNNNLFNFTTHKGYYKKHPTPNGPSPTASRSVINPTLQL